MGRRVITSLFGIPVIVIASLLLLLLINTVIELITGNSLVWKVIILSLTILGLIFLMAFAALKKQTVAKIFWSSAGAR